MNTGRERTLSWAFEKPGQDSSALMNLVNLPMKNAVATKRMLKQKAPSQGASDRSELKKKVLQSIKVEDLEGADLGTEEAEQQSSSFRKRKSASVFGVQEAATEDVMEDDEVDMDSGDGPASKKSKAAHKKSTFSGYSQAEKDVYSVLVKGEDDVDTRACTALDEVLQALKFASYYLDAKEEGKSLSEIPSMLAATFDGLLKQNRIASFSFCVGVFMEFLFQGKVCINGKDCRAYSSLRVELQNILIKSNETFSVEVTEGEAGPIGQKRSSSSSTTSRRSHTALELAELLCSAYMSTPATSVDFGESEEAVDEEDRMCEETHAVLGPFSFSTSQHVHSSTVLP